MKIMIDTNIFISAALFPKGRAAEALFKALAAPYQPVVCDYVIDELHRKGQFYRVTAAGNSRSSRFTASAIVMSRVSSNGSVTLPTDTVPT